jgi:hypothetical protein
MQIRIRETGAVMFWNEFRALLLAQNPSELITVAAQTEEWLDAHGADVVFEGPQATGGTVYQYSQRSGVEQIEGKWYTKYILGPVFTDRPATDTEPAQTAAEQEAAYKAMKDAEQAASIRSSRNDKLKDCDWTQIADSTADKAVWATYRQALRDITAQAGFPWTIDWPVAP